MACIAKRRNRWVIDFYDNQGKRRWKTLPKGTTKAKAREAMREIEDQVARGIYLPDRKIPTFSKVAKDWLEYKKPNVRESTLKMYKGHLKHHFQDVDNIKINWITMAKVERFTTDRQTNDMSFTTLRKLIVTFNQVMNYAARHKHISHNPVRDAERPRGQGRSEKEQIRILTPSEINGWKMLIS